MNIVLLLLNCLSTVSWRGGGSDDGSRGLECRRRRTDFSKSRDTGFQWLPVWVRVHGLQLLHPHQHPQDKLQVWRYGKAFDGFGLTVGLSRGTRTQSLQTQYVSTLVMYCILPSWSQLWGEGWGRGGSEGEKMSTALTNVDNEISDGSFTSITNNVTIRSEVTG